MEEAQQMGAIALFGEKYGDKVRVIAFDKDYSAELCGGTHVHSTGQIGLFKIISEGAIAAGIRRIEAVTGKLAEDYVNEKIQTLNQARDVLKNPKDVLKAIEQLHQENEKLSKQIQHLQKAQAGNMIDELKQKAQKVGDINFISVKLAIDAQMAKDLAFEMKKQMESLFMTIGHFADGKAGITIIISDNLVSENQFDAGKIVRELAKEIQGSGGGQPHFATAGGKNPNGLDKAISRAIEFISK
jgi:alanyl-tRNA synthetase